MLSVPRPPELSLSCHSRTTGACCHCISVWIIHSRTRSHPAQFQIQPLEKTMLIFGSCAFHFFSSWVGVKGNLDFEKPQERQFSPNPSLQPSPNIPGTRISQLFKITSKECPPLFLCTLQMPAIPRFSPALQRTSHCLQTSVDPQWAHLRVYHALWVDY